MTPAVRAAERAGIPFRVLTFEVPARDDYGRRAAAALGVAPARVFKTLVAALDGHRLAVALVPVTGELDLKALAGLAGARRAALAPAADAERATGYVVGGISPLGQRRRLPTFLDASALALERIYVSGGRRGLELELAPADLARLTGATVGPLAR